MVQEPALLSGHASRDFDAHFALSLLTLHVVLNAVNQCQPFHLFVKGFVVGF
jgi:hypothetical protein